MEVSCDKMRIGTENRKIYKHICQWICLREHLNLKPCIFFLNPLNIGFKLEMKVKHGVNSWFAQLDGDNRCYWGFLRNQQPPFKIINYP